MDNRGKQGNKEQNDRSLNFDSNRTTRRRFLATSLAAAGALFTAKLSAECKTFVAATPDRKVDFSGLRAQFKGQVVVPDQPEFKQYAYNGLWNRLHPKRLPNVIARVANEQDVVNAVKFAKENKLKVVVRGGGHNWCCPSLRNGGMMIDLTDLNQVISLDVEGRKAVVQPIISNREIQRILNAKGLSYPSGHCPPVKLSGYLLSGGMSWNQGVWGPGCASVEAIELVTAEGKMITASKDQNNDYFWAARGAGPGLFAVATRYHLKLYPLPKHITGSSYYYSVEHLETVADWLGKTASKLPSNVELSLFFLSAPSELADKCKDHAGKVCQVTATVFADSQEEAKSAIKLLDQCPVISECLAKTQSQPLDFERLFDASGALWPAERRNQVEAIFSNAEPGKLYGALRSHFLSVPSPETLIMFAFFTGPDVPVPPPADAAFSMSARLYGGPWTMWKDAADDDANNKWHRRCLEILKPFTAGHYVSESDTVTYPEHVKEAYSAKNLKRLEELRQKYDPDGVFFSFSDGLS